MAAPGTQLDKGTKAKGQPSPALELDSNDVVQDVWNWRATFKSALVSIWDLLLERLPILERGAVPTIWSDPINRLESIFMTQLTNTITLDGDTVFDSNTINLIAGHGFVADEQIVISDVSNPDDPHIYYGTVLVSNATDVEVDQPLDHAYAAASFAFRGTNNMNVVGTVGAPQVFSIQAPLGHKWDITRLIIHMITSSAPDDGKFGGVAKLTNGVTLRLCRNHDVECYNQANWKDNGEIKNKCFDVNYSDRTVPLGSYGVNARWTFAGPEKMGSVIRLRGGDSIPLGPQDRLELIIQDDLSGLTSFRIELQGHWVDLVWNGE